MLFLIIFYLCILCITALSTQPSNPGKMANRTTNQVVCSQLLAAVRLYDLLYGPYRRNWDEIAAVSKVFLILQAIGGNHLI